MRLGKGHNEQEKNGKGTIKTHPKREDSTTTCLRYLPFLKTSSDECNSRSVHYKLGGLLVLSQQAVCSIGLLIISHHQRPINNFKHHPSSTSHSLLLCWFLSSALRNWQLCSWHSGGRRASRTIMAHRWKIFTAVPILRPILSQQAQKDDSFLVCWSVKS